MEIDAAGQRGGAGGASECACLRAGCARVQDNLDSRLGDSLFVSPALRCECIAHLLLMSSRASVCVFMCACALAQAEVEFTTNNLDYPVARLMIGGPADKKDRIFFSSAQSIRGVTRKGKEFFRFATDGAEVGLAYA